MSKYYYSTNDEDYDYEDPRDAIDACMGIKPDELITIYRGTLVTGKASDYAPDIIDQISNNAYDTAGECADSWPGFDKAKSDDLQYMVNRAIDAWADKHGLQPTFGEIKNIKHLTYKLNAKGKDDDDIDADDYELICTIDVDKN